MEILDGPESNIFHYFRSLILRGLMELRKHVDSFVKIIDIMSRGSKMPCFPNTSEIPTIISKFNERFHLNKSDTEYIKVVEDLINSSMNNWRTVQYDNFQRLTNDIRP
jgi:phosphatidylinositol kinase/protein kinase (PI-3  family)